MNSVIMIGCEQDPHIFGNMISGFGGVSLLWFRSEPMLRRLSSVASSVPSVLVPIGLGVVNCFHQKDDLQHEHRDHNLFKDPEGKKPQRKAWSVYHTAQFTFATINLCHI